jgi:hypothetical protein
VSGLPPWSERVREEAALFNPAFCGGLCFEFVKAYQNAKGQPVALPLIFCALPMALHPATREALPGTILNSLYTWIEDNAAASIGYSTRVQHLSPIIKEALRFSIDRDVLRITENGDLSIGSATAAFTPTFLQNATVETKGCVTAVRQIGRWFARAGLTSTILSGLRIAL